LGCRAAGPLQKLPWRRKATLHDRFGLPSRRRVVSRPSGISQEGQKAEGQKARERNAFLFLEDQNQKYFLRRTQADALTRFPRGNRRQRDPQLSALLPFLLRLLTFL
jgi:hypothetical protein